jgi:ABC-type multidrug transport system ATPase subunit
MASIRTAGLTKHFGDLRAVNAINLDLPEGGVAGFVGPNGAGKSTTIRMLLGLIAPAESLAKGSRVVVVGRLQQRSWTAEAGSARSTVEVLAEELGASLRWAMATTTRATRSQSE